jgi:ribosomal protein S18 acetylase RimI-like enzyme
VSLLAPLVRLFAALDDLLEHSERTAWGATVTDSRFPLIYDANYARIDGQTDASLNEVEALLMPQAMAAGVRFVHIVAFDPQRTPRIVREMSHGSPPPEVNVDTVMRVDPRRDPDGEHRVVELEHGPELWAHLSATLPEFDVKDPQTIEQLVRWQREVFAPQGKRWFAVAVDGAVASSGSMIVRDDAAYVDDVITLPWARRRGIAAAIVRHMIGLADEGGAEHVYLLADEPGPIRLYERLGFEAIGESVGSLRQLG